MRRIWKQLTWKLKKIFCVIFGHTNIHYVWFGYHDCARCGERLGDSLASIYFNDSVVATGHNCEQCRTNYKKLRWHEKILAPYPFTEEEEKKKETTSSLP